MGRLIDADYVLSKIGEYAMHPNEELVNNLAIAFDIVVDAPTIDAVSVVRCKDCKYCHYEQKDDIYHCYKLFHRFYDTDNYCSYGERTDL